MTGRARGRSRGRARATQPQEAAARPGAPPPREEAPQQQVARGRGRATAAAVAPTPTAAPMQAKPAADVQQVTTKMAEVSVSGRDEQREPRTFTELVTKPQNVQSIRGTYGNPVGLCTNYFQMVQTPQFDGFYQYEVQFNPPIESRNFKNSLVKEHRETLGTVRAFDGMTLYLPKKLPEHETKLMSVTKRDQQSIEITIIYRNHFPFKSPNTLQLMNVIFRRYDSLSCHKYCFECQLTIKITA